ncbi:Arc family DNA-binding protein [Variovorax paradoxus]|uniref:Arc family DNA-binding protein n=1 Tax=Variovorax paradoxus TaxID=34073 RepID=UPI001ABCC72D
MNKAMQPTPTPVRLPDELKATLKAEAEANDRSLNGEIVSRLRASLKAERKNAPDQTNRLVLE